MPHSAIPLCNTKTNRLSSASVFKSSMLLRQFRTNVALSSRLPGASYSSTACNGFGDGQ